MVWLQQPQSSFNIFHFSISHRVKSTAKKRQDGDSHLNPILGAKMLLQIHHCILSISVYLRGKKLWRFKDLCRLCTSWIENFNTRKQTHHLIKELQMTGYRGISLTHIHPKQTQCSSWDKSRFTYVLNWQFRFNISNYLLSLTWFLKKKVCHRYHFIFTVFNSTVAS